MASGTIQRAAPDNAESLFKIVSYTIEGAGEWALNEVTNYTANEFYQFGQLNGYTPICINRFSSGKNQNGVCLVNVLATGTANAMITRCLKAFTTDGMTTRIDILYARTGFVE